MMNVLFILCFVITATCSYKLLGDKLNNLDKDCKEKEFTTMARSPGGKLFVSQNRSFWILNVGEFMNNTNVKRISDTECSFVPEVAVWVGMVIKNYGCDFSKDELSESQLLLLPVSNS